MVYLGFERYNKFKYKIVEKGKEEPLEYNGSLMVFRTNVALREFLPKLESIYFDIELEVKILSDEEHEKYMSLFYKDDKK